MLIDTRTTFASNFSFCNQGGSSQVQYKREVSKEAASEENFLEAFAKKKKLKNEVLSEYSNPILSFIYPSFCEQKRFLKSF